MSGRYHMLFLVTFTVICTLAYGSNTTQSPSTGAKNIDTFKNLDTGMKPLYNLTQGFLEVVQPKKGSVLRSAINITEILETSIFDYLQKNYKTVLHFYAGYLACVIFGLLFVVIMPIIALVFCCCRCCGKCGGKADEYETKHARNKCICYTIFIFVLALIVLAMVVCSFITVTLAYQRFEAKDETNPFQQALSSYKKYEKFLDDVSQEIEEDLPKDARNLIDEIKSATNQTVSSSIDQIMEGFHVTEILNSVESLHKDLNATTKNLLTIESSLNKVTDLTDQLKKSLHNIQTNATDSLSTCPAQVKRRCDVLLSKIERLVPTANFSSFDHLKNLRKRIQEVKGFEVQIEKVRHSFDDLKSKHDITKGVATAVNAIDDAGKEILKEVESATEKTGDIVKKLKFEGLDNTVNDADKTMKQYTKYWYYPLIVICVIITLIVTLHFLGILAGLCSGERGTTYDRPAAANILMAGAAFYLIFAFLFMLVVVIFFVPGGFVYTEICRYTINHDPDALRVYTDHIDLEKLIGREYKIDLATALKNCEKNQGLYTAINGSQIKNLSGIIGLDDISKEVDKVNITIPPLKVKIPTKFEKDLRKFSNSGFQNVNLSSYQDEITLLLKELPKSRFTGLSEELKDFAPRSGKETELNKIANSIDELSNDLVPKLRSESVKLNNSLTDLKPRLKSKDTVMNLLNQTLESVQEFNANGTAAIKNKVKEIKKKISTDITKKATDLIKKLEKETGACRELYNAFYMGTDAVCVAVLNPLNGFWFSVAWCTVFCIPLIILAIKLAGIFRAKYSYADQTSYGNGGGYSYDGHVDTIPLTSMKVSQSLSKTRETLPKRSSDLKSTPPYIKKSSVAPLPEAKEQSQSSVGFIEFETFNVVDEPRSGNPPPPSVVSSTQNAAEKAWASCEKTIKNATRDDSFGGQTSVSTKSSGRKSPSTKSSGRKSPSTKSSGRKSPDVLKPPRTPKSQNKKKKKDQPTEKGGVKPQRTKKGGVKGRKTKKGGVKGQQAKEGDDIKVDPELQDVVLPELDVPDDINKEPDVNAQSEN